MATTLEMLLAQLAAQGGPGLPAPAPSANIPLLPAPTAPISTGPSEPRTMEEMMANSIAPVAPTEPLDQNLIRQIMALGPQQAPTPPAPLSRGQRIANALMGFGAGVQGNGAQFLQQLQEPQREYQRQLQVYNNERGRFGLAALEAAQGKQERAQAERQRRADIQAQRDWDLQLDKMKFTNDAAKEQARQAFQLELEARKEREAQEKQQRQIEAQTEKDRRQFEVKYKEDGASPTIAKELSQYATGQISSLSTAANKWVGSHAKELQARTERLARIAAGGGQAGEKDVREIVDAQGNVIERLPINKIPFDSYGKIKGYPKGAHVRPSLAPQQQAAPSMPASPYLNPVGESGMLSETLPGGIRMSTPKPKFTRAQAKAKLVRAGYSSAKADAELDRLGIQ